MPWIVHTLPYFFKKAISYKAINGRGIYAPEYDIEYPHMKKSLYMHGGILVTETTVLFCAVATYP
jgi:hypothetical protein